MPTERLPMRKVREMLRLKHDLGLTHRAIGRALSVSSGAVGGVVSRAKAAGLDWPTASALSEVEVETRLYPKSVAIDTDQVRPLPDFALLHTERLKVGVTLQLLHLEYQESHPKGYGYTQFCEHYQRWLATRGLTMRQEHLAGAKVFVDYSGKRPSLVDKDSDEPVAVELFVGVLGASSYTYAEATRTQRVPDFIASHGRMLAFFGGVPKAMVPDQLKSAVTAASRYEPGLQRTYEDFAEHYGTAIVPARPAKPRDKAMVEAAVLVAQRWILARMRSQRFFSLDEMNVRIRELLIDLNERRMRRFGVSRRERFEKSDKLALMPLPEKPYTFATWAKARVGRDYHVDVGGHGYSVPHALVGQLIEIRATANVVEVFQRGKRVTTHVRCDDPGKNTTCSEHQPVAHRKHAEWTPERIMHWAEEVGPGTAGLATAILAERPHPEQGYRSCLGILRLEKRYDRARLEAACQRALLAGARSYTHVASILKNGLDRLKPAISVETPLRPLAHENVRGPAAFDN